MHNISTLLWWVLILGISTSRSYLWKQNVFHITTCITRPSKMELNIENLKTMCLCKQATAIEVLQPRVICT